MKTTLPLLSAHLTWHDILKNYKKLTLEKQILIGFLAGVALLITFPFTLFDPDHTKKLFIYLINRFKAIKDCNEKVQANGKKIDEIAKKTLEKLVKNPDLKEIESIKTIIINIPQKEKEQKLYADLTLQLAPPNMELKEKMEISLALQKILNKMIDPQEKTAIISQSLRMTELIPTLSLPFHFKKKNDPHYLSGETRGKIILCIAEIDSIKRESVVDLTLQLINPNIIGRCLEDRTSIINDLKILSKEHLNYFKQSPYFKLLWSKRENFNNQKILIDYLAKMSNDEKDGYLDFVEKKSSFKEVWEWIETQSTAHQKIEILKLLNSCKEGNKHIQALQSAANFMRNGGKSLIEKLDDVSFFKIINDEVKKLKL